MDIFERVLSVSDEDLEIWLRDECWVPWSDFILNPRRLRGSDFLMRWSQGVWSEERIVQAINETGRYWALPYGPSGTAPDDDPRAFELYFERLEHAGLGGVKRPDLLVFPKRHEEATNDIVRRLGGIQELPFTSEDDETMKGLLSRAVLAVECENSLWKAKKMPNYGTALEPQKRLGGRLGMKKSAVLPTVIIKEEDRAPLQEWQGRRKISIHVWHVFFDLAFGLALDTAGELIQNGSIEPTQQTFQAPGGATTKKVFV